MHERRCIVSIRLNSHKHCETFRVHLEFELKARPPLDSFAQHFLTLGTHSVPPNVCPCQRAVDTQGVSDRFGTLCTDLVVQQPAGTHPRKYMSGASRAQVLRWRGVVQSVQFE